MKLENRQGYEEIDSSIDLDSNERSNAEVEVFAGRDSREVVPTQKISEIELSQNRAADQTSLTRVREFLNDPSHGELQNIQTPKYDQGSGESVPLQVEDAGQNALEEIKKQEQKDLIEKSLLKEFNQPGGIKDKLIAYKNNAKVERQTIEDYLRSSISENFFYDLSRHPEALKQVMDTLTELDKTNIHRPIMQLRIRSLENMTDLIYVKDMNKYLQS